MKHIDLDYDFRSPFAYFAFHRLELLTNKGVSISWKPVLVSGLINLQVNKEPEAVVSDPLSPSKRAHFMSDIFRLIAYWEIPFAPPTPTPPVCDTAMALAALLEAENIAHSEFIAAVFKAVWQEQKDAEAPAVLEALLECSGINTSLLSRANTEGRGQLLANTRAAYEKGVFGTPTFICNDELYFGADRMELLASTL